MRAHWLLASLMLLPGCKNSPPAAEPDLAMLVDMTLPPDLAWDHQIVALRPYSSKVPKSYDPAKATPLVLALHGLGDTGENLAAGLGFMLLAESRGFLLAYPDGTPTGFQGGYWNANDVCCQLSSPTPDDVAYLGAVISDMSEKYNVDPKQVFVIGLSNGGMMAHRLACDLSSRIAAVVSLSGAQYNDQAKCQPTQPVAVLEVHGDADPNVPYKGGKTLGGNGPLVGSAHATIQVWVDRNGCGAAAEKDPAINLDGMLAGSETTVERWPGCKPGGAAELWTVVGGAHIPRLTPSAPGLLYDWLKAHARP
ncbi:MAG: hypothetical protein EXR72_18630 [Myxococcales bacterium]|nr:hypothetical protein [Myxococcales bacterium]